MIAALLAMAAAAVPAPPLRCGAVERPGIAEQGEDGTWRGVAVDLCRQAAHGQPIAFHAYREVDDLRAAPRDALAVLSRAELAIARPGASGPSTPPAAISRQLLLVRPGATVHAPADLAGHRVCFLIATAAEAALDAWAGPARVAIERVGFQEAAELRDAFDFGYCAAMAVDAADIPGGAAQTVPLGEPLAQVALFAIPMAGG